MCFMVIFFEKFLKNKCVYQKYTDCYTEKYYFYDLPKMGRLGTIKPQNVKIGTIQLAAKVSFCFLFMVSLLKTKMLL